MRKKRFLIICLILMAALILISAMQDDSGMIATYVGIWGEVLVGLISALLIVWQLSREAAVEEAAFITEYNRSFVENEHMTMMERYMECQLSGAAPDNVKLFTEHRQDMVNYLVYMEGFAACILKKIIRFRDIDDLFAYRFFLALNHPEILSIDLLPCASYYRSCFRLYDRWMDYRETCGKYEEEVNWEIPLFESALCHYYGYETYALPEITAEKTGEGKITARWKRRERVLSYEVLTDQAEGYKYLNNVSFSKTGWMHPQKYKKLLRAALKELLYKENVTKIQNCENNKITELYTQLVEARNILYRDGVHFRQLHSGYKISKDNLKRLAELIYDTDDRIFPDLFGTKDNAAMVLPRLLASGKDPMFCLDNIFVCELEDKIIGMILWYQKPQKWNIDTMGNAFQEAKKNSEPKDMRKPDSKECYKPDYRYDKEKAHRADEQYIASYEKNASACKVALANVCVSAKMQNFGFGRKMLQQFLEHPQWENVKMFELCVLKDNKNAIKLYKSCGFRVVDEEEAYPSGCKDRRLIMQRTNE